MVRKSKAPKSAHKLDLLNSIGLLDAMSDAISVQDTSLRVLYQNTAHKKLVGDHVGEYCYAAYQQKDEACKGCHLLLAFRDGLCHTRETSTRTDRGIRYVEISSSPIRDVNGVIIAGIESVRDVTERREAEEKLRLQQAAMETSMDGIAIYDTASDCFRYVNQSQVKMFGYDSAAELLNQSWHLIYTSEEVARFERDIKKLIQRDRKWRGEVAGKRRDGSTFPVEISVTVMEDGNVIAIASDITERKEAENQYRKANDQLRVIFDTIQAGIILVNSAGIVTFANQRMADMFGCPIDELIGSSYPEHVHPDQRHVGDKRMQALIAGRIDHVFSERHYICKDGRDFWGHLSGRRLEDAEGNLISLVGVIADITDLKKAQHDLQESEERFRKMIEESPISMAIVSLDGSIDYINNCAVDTFGYLPEEIPHMNDWWLKAYPDADYRNQVISQWMGLVDKAITENHRYIERREYRVFCKDGSFKTMLIFGMIVSDKVFVLFEDISERKQIEDKIFQLNCELERMVAERTADLKLRNEELSTFCYAVSHELRAPIARLQGFSSILGETCNDSSETSFMVARIADASIQLQTVVDSILMLSRLSRMELSPQLVDLSGLAQRKLDLLLEENADRRVDTAISPGISAVADPNLIDVCLSNIIGNAFKYTVQNPEARIEFGLMNESGKNIYYVRDNGVGFDMAYSEKLYAPFQRLHLQGHFPGIGIGLATVKKIIERHGGEIWAESKPGEGATFFFTLSAS